MAAATGNGTILQSTSQKADKGENITKNFDSIHMIFHLIIILC
jgi:hypothetical protein